MSIRIRLYLLVLAVLMALTPCTYAQPAAPTNVVAAPGDKSAQVSFDSVPNAVFYNIYSSTISPVTKLNAMVLKSVGAAAAVPKLVNDKKYYFVVTAVDSSNVESAFSSESNTTPVAAPAAPPDQPDSATTPMQPASNVGQSTDTNVQNPNMTFTSFVPATYSVLTIDPKTNKSAGAITYDLTGVETLIKGACGASASAMDDGSTYAIINVINLGGTNAAQNVESSYWYVYSTHKSFGSGFAGGWRLTNFDGATRLYGAKKIILISILENDLSPSDVASGPTVAYKFTITKQQATNIADAIQLLGLAFPKRSVAGPAAPPKTNYMACSVVPVAYKTSTIKVDLAYTAPGNTPYAGSQSFVNEAKEHWDVSFALPIKKASALQYSSTANTVTASEINKSDLYAVIDWYPYPVDLKNSKFNYIPGLFAGVAMNSQPLHSLIFGTSIGTKFAQFYAGALVLKTQNLNGLSTGSAGSASQVTSATSYAYKPQFSIGIKISISAAASALAGSK